MFVLTGVDDAESECGLDSGVTWDVIVSNNDENDELEQSVQHILEIVSGKMKVS